MAELTSITASNYRYCQIADLSIVFRPIVTGEEMNEEIEETQAMVDPPGAETAAADPSAEESPPVEQLDRLAELRHQLAQLTEETAKYHTRAERREAIIDTMHAELEQLRRGERRSLLRPLVTQVCRTRDDLLRQADTLPEDFERDRAAVLLRSFASSLAYSLEDHGVDSFMPEPGESFDAGRHRVAGKSPTGDESLAGTVESVVAPGYRDTEAGTVICAARVVVYVAQVGESADDDPEENRRETPDPDPAG
jgi:molecular chaperone GrpE (heat shock protein)